MTSALSESGVLQKRIAQEVTGKRRNSTTAFWQKRESVRVHLRNLVHEQAAT